MALVACEPTTASFTEPAVDDLGDQIAESAGEDLWDAIRSDSPFPEGDVDLFGVLARDQTDTERRVVYFVGDTQFEFLFVLDEGWHLERKVGDRPTRRAVEPQEGPALTLPGYPNTIAKVWDVTGYLVEPECTDPGITQSGWYKCPVWYVGSGTPKIQQGTFLIDTLQVGDYEYRFETGSNTWFQFYNQGYQWCYTASCWFGSTDEVEFQFEVWVTYDPPPPPWNVWISDGPSELEYARRYWWEAAANHPFQFTLWQIRLSGDTGWASIDSWSVLNPQTSGPQRLYLEFPVDWDDSFWLRAAPNNEKWTDPYFVDVEGPLPPPPLTAHIAGDEDVAPDEECAWQAVATGGYPPYSYSWWGGVTGSSRNVFGSLAESSYIWLQVTDAQSNSVSDQLFVDVDGAYECEF